MKKNTLYLYAFLITIVLVVEIIKYLNIFPTHRFAQIYWHMTNSSTIEIKSSSMEVCLPIKWIVAKETSTQYYLHGDYVDKTKTNIKTVILQKEPLKNDFKSLFYQKCQNNKLDIKEYNINERTFHLIGCKELKEGGALAIVYDEAYKLNMLVYDYKTSDNKDILRLLEGISYISH